MVYIKLDSFMRDTFGGRAKEIMEDAMSKTGIVDVDNTTNAQRKKFADYVLTYHLNFSPQRNRYLYDALLKSLDIGSMFDLSQFRETEKLVKEHENIILTSFQLFWHRIEKLFNKYEVVLNLFWIKGVEAELKGVNKSYVNKVIKNTLISIKKDMDESFEQLIQDLDLGRFKHKHTHLIFKIQLFEDISYGKDEEPDEDSLFIINTLEELREHLTKVHTHLENLFLSTLDKELELKKKGLDDQKFIADLKETILAECNIVSGMFNRKYKELEKKFSS